MRILSLATMNIDEKYMGAVMDEGHIVSRNSHTKSESSGLSRAIEIDPIAEKRLVRKLDWILLPLFTIICGLFSLKHCLALITLSQIAPISLTGKKS